MNAALLGIVAAIALPALTPAIASADGMSDAARACEPHNGWQTLYRPDGTGFRNPGDCVRYTAHGGTFTVGFARGTVTATSTDPYPPDVRFGVAACPADEPFGADCAGLTIAVTTDAAGDYSMPLAPGAYNLVGFAQLGPGGPTTAPALFASPAALNQVVEAGKVVTLNWSFATTLYGTVTPTQPFPAGTTYGVLACQPGTITFFGCFSGLVANAVPYDSAGHYVMLIAPGTYDVDGYALPGGTPPARDTNQGVTRLTITMGQNVNMNWTVTPQG